MVSDGRKWQKFLVADSLDTITVPGPVCANFPVVNAFCRSVSSVCAALHVHKRLFQKWSYFYTWRDFRLKRPEELKPLEIGDIPKLLIESRQEV